MSIVQECLQAVRNITLIMSRCRLKLRSRRLLRSVAGTTRATGTRSRLKRHCFGAVSRAPFLSRPNNNIVALARAAATLVGGFFPRASTSLCRPVAPATTRGNLCDVIARGGRGRARAWRFAAQWPLWRRGETGRQAGRVSRVPAYKCSAGI